MAIQINGNGTITGISVGGLPDGIVDTDMIANGAASGSKLTMPTGSIIQTKHLQFTTAVNGTASSTTDVAGFNLAITPSSASNDILIILHFSGILDCDGRMGLKRNGTEIVEHLLGTDRSEENDTGTFCGTYKDSPNSTSAVTYQVTVKVTGCNSTYHVNTPQQGGGDNGRSGMTLLEVKG